MEQDIKNKEPQGRTKYVPASVKVIEVTAQKIICQSPGNYNNPWANPDSL